MYDQLNSKATDRQPTIAALAALRAINRVLSRYGIQFVLYSLPIIFILSTLDCVIALAISDDKGWRKLIWLVPRLVILKLFAEFFLTTAFVVIWYFVVTGKKVSISINRAVVVSSASVLLLIVFFEACEIFTDWTLRWMSILPLFRNSGIDKVYIHALGRCVLSFAQVGLVCPLAIVPLSQMDDRAKVPLLHSISLAFSRWPDFQIGLAISLVGYWVTPITSLLILTLLGVKAPETHAIWIFPMLYLQMIFGIACAVEYLAEALQSGEMAIPLEQQVAYFD